MIKPLTSFSLLFLTLIMALPWQARGEAQTIDNPKQPVVIFPRDHLEPEEIGIIVNAADPLSTKIGKMYRQKRNIPLENVVEVRINPARDCWDAKGTVMKRGVFERLKRKADKTVPSRVQAYVLTWNKPYRVECMSITTALAFGFDKKFCSKTCSPTKISPYFNSDSVRPYDDFGIRPSMALTGRTYEDVERLVDRAVLAEETNPGGTAYLVDLGTQNPRNARARLYPGIVQFMGGKLKTQVVTGSHLENKEDVLFYFIGKGKVENISTNTFLPGAVADHLTSAGGQLTDSYQMSCLDWLEAGAAGSYGAVIEPCNFLQKFPHPGIILARYSTGETLLEAYWKSVQMPGQGIFAGDPLTRPFGGHTVTFKNGILYITLRSMRPGYYSLVKTRSGLPPYTFVMRNILVNTREQVLKLPYPEKTYYLLIREEPKAASQ